VSGNKASYRPGTVRIPKDAVINMKNRSFTLTAELENAVGGETGGYAHRGRREGPRPRRCSW
jgi:hypothetical protein